MVCWELLAQGSSWSPHQSWDRGLSLNEAESETRCWGDMGSGAVRKPRRAAGPYRRVLLCLFCFVLIVRSFTVACLFKCS